MAEHRLSGKVAVVTGGASGIGLATVHTFVREGASVVFCDLAADSKSALIEDIGSLKSALHHTRRPRGGDHDGDRIAADLGAHATFIECDVTDPQALEHVIDAACSKYGGIDIMYNNAGVGGNEGPIVSSPIEIFDRIIDVDLRGVYFGIKFAARRMIEQGRGGSIISTSSTGAFRAFAGLGAYSAAKAGVIQLSCVAALELASHNIRVNSVCPGRILTPLIYDSPMRDEPVTPESLFDYFRNGQPLPIVGLPDDIANAALWLASDDSRFVTGQALSIDGGISIEGDRSQRGGSVQTTGAGFGA